MKSIMTDDWNECLICGSEQMIERHHVFPGPFRKKSEKYGLVVPLCKACHNLPPDGVHFNKANADALKAEVQIAAMEEYGWSVNDFIREFGKNYL